ncbi:hypothetical protein TSMEX_011113 [Taenia solium]|eukprot:TsM_000358900 transcript=TsM_000358900 gene=TsM_000358900
MPVECEAVMAAKLVVLQTGLTVLPRLSPLNESFLWREPPGTRNIRPDGDVTADYFDYLLVRMERFSKEHCQTIVTDENKVGLRNSLLSTTRLLSPSTWLVIVGSSVNGFRLEKIDPRLSPLGVFVKRWAQRMDIHGGNCGKLSTYALLLMVIQYLQCGCSPPLQFCRTCKLVFQ